MRRAPGGARRICLPDELVAFGRPSGKRRPVLFPPRAQLLARLLSGQRASTDRVGNPASLGDSGILMIAQRGTLLGRQVRDAFARDGTATHSTTRASTHSGTEPGARADSSAHSRTSASTGASTRDCAGTSAATARSDGTGQAAATLRIHQFRPGA